MRTSTRMLLVALAAMSCAACATYRPVDRAGDPGVLDRGLEGRTIRYREATGRQEWLVVTRVDPPFLVGHRPDGKGPPEELEVDARQIRDVEVVDPSLGRHVAGGIANLAATLTLLLLLPLALL